MARERKELHLRGGPPTIVSTRKWRAVRQQDNLSSDHLQIPRAPGYSSSDDDTRTGTAGSQTTIDNTSQENPPSGNPTTARTATSLTNHRVAENRVCEVGLKQPSSSTTPLIHDDIPAIVCAIMNNLTTRINNCSP